MKNNYILNYKKTGTGPTIIMLHGLSGTSQYFDRITKYLPEHTIISIDLLGFGSSPKPSNIKYTVENHISAIHNTIIKLNLKQSFGILGISMGAVLALEYAKKYPEHIKNIYLVSPTIYSNPEVAKQKIDETRAPNILMFGPVAKFVCKQICARHKLAKKINPIVMRHIPKDVARTVCEHSWESYSYSMQNIVINQPKQDISTITKLPIFFIYDHKDNLIEESFIKELTSQSKKAKIVYVDGGHGMLVNNTPLVADALKRLL